MFLNRCVARFPTWKNYKFLIELKTATFAQSLSPVLIYHAIEPSHKKNPLISGKSHSIPPEMLHQQLSLLKKYFNFISLQEFTQSLQKGQNIRGLAVVTFDDGYLSVIKWAVPILNDLNIPATFFISTKLIQEQTFWRDKVRYIINQNLIRKFLSFARAENQIFQVIKADPEGFYRDTKNPAIINSRVVEKMLDVFLVPYKKDISWMSQDIYCTPEILHKECGKHITFGNHSHSHYVLSSMDKDEQYEEIIRTEHILRDLNLPLSRIFSIPFGGERDFNRDTLDILQDIGYRGYALSVGYRVVNAHLPTQHIKEQHQLVALQRFMPINHLGFLWMK